VDLTNFLVAIPAFNEDQTISQVIQEIKEAFPTLELVVINDGSIDLTSKLARRAGAKVIDMPFNVGVGGAMRTAFQYALENNFKFLIQFDADGQHDCASIQQLMDASPLADVVVGSRFNSESVFRISRIRKSAIKILRLIVRRAVRFSISDPTSGFRIANEKAMVVFAQEYPTSYLGDTVGSLILAGQRNLKVHEIDVVMHNRKGGTASQNWTKLPIHLVRVLLIGLLFFFDTKIALRRK